MRVISLFNNKGGVGKTTLAFHASCALAELNYRVLMIDLDPQCNLSLYAINEEELLKIWSDENDLVDGSGFDETKKKIGSEKFRKITQSPRTIHFLLKPTEEGTGEIEMLPPTVKVRENLDIIPGRLTLHMYEYKISERWSATYQGDPLSIRTITKIRTIAKDYSEKFNYDYVIIDTSPSLGALNKVIISTVDGFIIPCSPDVFSLYGIRNIGNALSQWKKEFDTIYQLITDEKRKNFPEKFVQFLGYTIYNAKKYKDRTKWDLATAHFNYAKKVPETIRKFISDEIREHLSENMLVNPIGNKSIMHSHSTLPGMAQKYKTPIWAIPDHNGIEQEDQMTISGNKVQYKSTQSAYRKFVQDLLERLNTLG